MGRKLFFNFVGGKWLNMDKFGTVMAVVGRK